jgi:hypothetical protein
VLGRVAAAGGPSRRVTRDERESRCGGCVSPRATNRSLGRASCSSTDASVTRSRWLRPRTPLFRPFRSSDARLARRSEARGSDSGLLRGPHRPPVAVPNSLEDLGEAIEHRCRGVKLARGEVFEHLAPQRLEGRAPLLAYRSPCFGSRDTRPRDQGRCVRSAGRGVLADERVSAIEIAGMSGAGPSRRCSPL